MPLIPTSVEAKLNESGTCVRIVVALRWTAHETSVTAALRCVRMAFQQSQTVVTRETVQRHEK